MSATHTYYIENVSGSRRYFSTSESNINNSEAHEVHLSPASNHPVRVSSHSPRRMRSSVRVSSRSPVTIHSSCVPVHNQTYTVPTRISYERRPVRSYYAQRVHVRPYHSSYVPSRYVIDSRTYEGLRSGPRISRVSFSRKLAPIDEKNEEVFVDSAKVEVSENDSQKSKERYDYLETPMKACKYDEAEVSTDNEEDNHKDANVDKDGISEEKIVEDAEVLNVFTNSVSMKLKNWFRTNTAQDKIFSEGNSKKTCDVEEKKKIEKDLKGENKNDDNESAFSLCISINDQTPVRVFRKNSRNVNQIESSESMYQL